MSIEGFRASEFDTSFARATRSNSDQADARIVLEVVTRHLPTRARFLERQQESLTDLGPTGWTQTLLIDHEQRGLDYANTRLREFEPKGEWVWLLDDDDCSFATARFVEFFAKLNPDNGVELVVVQMHHGPLGILPPRGENDGWGLPPQGSIGSSSIIVTADLWRRTRHAWEPHYEGDYSWIKEAWKQARAIFWVPTVVCGVQRISKGNPEDLQ